MPSMPRHAYLIGNAPIVNINRVHTNVDEVKTETTTYGLIDMRAIFNKLLDC